MPRIKTEKEIIQEQALNELLSQPENTIIAQINNEIDEGEIDSTIFSKINSILDAELATNNVIVETFASNTIDLSSKSRVFKTTRNSNFSISFLNPQEGQSAYIIVVNPSASAITVNFVGVTWKNKVVNNIVNANSLKIFTYFRINGYNFLDSDNAPNKLNDILFSSFVRKVHGNNPDANGNVNIPTYCSYCSYCNYCQCPAYCDFCV